MQDLAPAPDVVDPDPFTDAAWLIAQRRIDYEKCKRVEAGGPFQTVWPADFIRRDEL
jgi:hypothetical protein